MPFDVTSINVLDQKTLELVSPTGEETGAFITILSDAHKTIRNLDRQYSIKQFSKGRRRPNQETIEEQDAHILLKVKTSIVDWSDIEIDGNPLVYSKSNVDTLLERAPWIRDFVLTAWVREDTFLEQTSAKSKSGSTTTLKQKKTTVA